MQPENDPFEKETHLPNLHFGVQSVSFFLGRNKQFVNRWLEGQGIFWQIEQWKKGPWFCRVFLGDEILPGYLVNIVNHYKDPYQTTRVSWKVTRVFVRGSVVGSPVNSVIPPPSAVQLAANLPSAQMVDSSLPIGSMYGIFTYTFIP